MHDHAATPSGRPQVCKHDSREDRLVNAVVALILSSFAGFTSAVLAAILGSGLLIAMLVYLGVSAAGTVAVLAAAMRRADTACEADAYAACHPVIECEATAACRAIYAQNRRKRLWYGLTLGLVMAGIWFTGDWAIACGILAACLAAFLLAGRCRRGGAPQAGTTARGNAPTGQATTAQEGAS